MQVRLRPWAHKREDGYWYVHGLHNRAFGGLETLGPFMSERLAVAHVGRLRRLEETVLKRCPTCHGTGSIEVPNPEHKSD